MEEVRERYSLAGVVGHGAYGNVFKATHVQTNVQVAIKVIPQSVLRDPDATLHFDNEINILSKLDHPLIGHLFEVVHGSDGICIVSEYAPGRDLLHFINTHKTITEPEACRIFKQILTGVKYLHDSHVAHRDLKPENILMDEHGNIRIIDFGFAKRFAFPGCVFNSRCGSLAYVAPEIITGKMYGPAVDIWSLGVILYAMMSNELPFVGVNTDEQLRKIAYSEPRINPSFSDNLKSLLRGMLCKDSTRRLTIEQIQAHPWLRTTKEDAFMRVIDKVTTDIDPEILRYMKLMGFELKNIEAKIQKNMKCEAVVAYRMLMRQKITHAMGNTRVGSLGSDAPLTFVCSPVRPQRPSAVTPLFRATRRNKENDPGVENDANAATKKLASPAPRAQVRPASRAVPKT